MKVLFATYPMAFHTPGGGEMQLLAYKKHLELNGIQVDLFDPWKPNFMAYDLVHYFSLVGGSVHFCHFIKQLGLPLVISSSLWITNETKYNYPYDEIKAQLALADAVVANSNIECDQLSDVFEDSRLKYKTVYNGVEDVFLESVSAEFFRAKYNLYDPFVLNVANIEPRKNQIKLAEAIKSFPDHRLVMMGHIRDKTYAEEVFNVAKDQIIFIGTEQHGGLYQRSAYAACDVFCLPSTLETPGLAALEAYAVGAKIALTEEGSTREYFQNDVQYIKPSKTESVVEALSKLIGKNNRITYEHSCMFLWDTVVQDLIKVYKDVTL